MFKMVEGDRKSCYDGGAGCLEKAGVRGGEKMKRKQGRGKRIGICMMSILVLFLVSSCAASQANMQSEIQGILVEDTPDWSYYSMNLRRLPDGLSELEKGLSEKQWIIEGTLQDHNPYRFAGDTIYRLLTLMGEGEKDVIMMEGRYLQTLNPPYDAWQTEDYTGKALPLYDETQETQEYSERELEQMIKVAGSGLAYHRDEDGRLYFGNKKTLWYFAGDQIKTLVHLSEGDLALTELTGFLVNGEEVTLWGKFGEKDYLATLQKADAPAQERQEIVLAASFVGVSMKQAIAEFNLLNPKWRIVTQEAGDGAYEEFRNRLQLEITDGKGPDILGGGVFLDAWEAFAEKGYLECLDGLFQGSEENYYDFCLQSGLVNGKRYALPVGGINIRVCVCGEETVRRGGFKASDPWEGCFSTAQELMAFVRMSHAETFQLDVFGEDDPFHFLYWYGGLENEGNPYLDPERGISHLDEGAFEELLQFSKDYYGKKQLFDEAEYAEDLQSGRIAVLERVLFGAGDILYVDAAFDGKQAYVGFPGGDGKRFRATFADMLMLNANSAKKEGVLEFFRYLLSKEGQADYVARGKEDGGILNVPFSIRRDVTEENLERAKHARTNARHLGNIPYDARAITEGEAEDVRRILEQSQAFYMDRRLNEILGIIEEEADAFYQGARSAKETAANCHNRVQLYLHENR